MSTGKVAMFSIAPGAVSGAGNTAAIGVAHGAGMATVGHGLAVAGAALGVGALAVGGAAAAVLLTRAAMSGMVKFSDTIEAGVVAWKHAEAEADAWEEAVLAVAARNARIRVLGSTLRKRGGVGADDGGGDFPGPLNPAGMTVRQLRAWCERTDGELDAHENMLPGLAAQQAVQALAYMPGGKGLVTYAQRVAPLRPVERATRGDGTTPARQQVTAPPSADATLAERIGAEISQELGTLPRDVSVADYTHVLHAAAKARQAAERGHQDSAEAWLVDVRLRAEEAMQNAQRRGDMERTAAVYLGALQSLDQEVLEGIVPPPDDDEAVAHVRHGLQAVLDGADLTAGLRADAEHVLMGAHARAEEAFIQIQLRTVLSDLDYNVVPAAQSGDTAQFTVGGQDLGDAVVRIELTKHEIMARIQPGASGWDDQRTGSWRRSWEEIQRSLAGTGLTTDVREFPGLVAVPSRPVVTEDDTDEERPGGTSAPRSRERGA